MMSTYFKELIKVKVKIPINGKVFFCARMKNKNSIRDARTPKPGDIAFNP